LETSIWKKFSIQTTSFVEHFTADIFCRNFAQIHWYDWEVTKRSTLIEKDGMGLKAAGEDKTAKGV
jgi:hypothetical protein